MLENFLCYWNICGKHKLLYHLVSFSNLIHTWKKISFDKDNERFEIFLISRRKREILEHQYTTKKETEVYLHEKQKKWKTKTSFHINLIVPTISSFNKWNLTPEHTNIKRVMCLGINLKFDFSRSKSQSSSLNSS